MALEIERKFLVTGDFRDEAYEAMQVVQGYLCADAGKTVRIRISGSRGYITVKGRPDPSGTERYEWEKEIPVGDAAELLKLCEPGVIKKTRYKIKYGRHLFEVDVFHGDNEGLIIAEVELSSPDEPIKKPAWIGREVTGDPRYYNSALSKMSFKNW